jgi:hypothetical protein
VVPADPAEQEHRMPRPVGTNTMYLPHLAIDAKQTHPDW